MNRKHKLLIIEQSDQLKKNLKKTGNSIKWPHEEELKLPVTVQTDHIKPILTIDSTKWPRTMVA